MLIFMKCFYVMSMKVDITVRNIIHFNLYRLWPVFSQIFTISINQMQSAKKSSISSKPKYL